MRERAGTAGWAIVDRVATTSFPPTHPPTHPHHARAPSGWTAPSAQRTPHTAFLPLCGFLTSTRSSASKDFGDFSQLWFFLIVRSVGVRAGVGDNEEERGTRIDAIRRETVMAGGSAGGREERRGSSSNDIMCSHVRDQKYQNMREAGGNE